MLSDELKQCIQQAYSEFLDAHTLKPRYGQKLMIAHIARLLGGIMQDSDGSRLGEKHLLAVEAGTGTGKTLAYAVSAIPMAQALDKTLVIATATVALQEQILDRDLPDIQRNTSLDFSLQLAKGRRRYLCLSRLDSILSGASGQTQALYPDEAMALPEERTLGLYQNMIDALASQQWDGDRDQWSDAIDDDLWLPVTTDHSHCSGRRCSFIRQCSFYRAREDLLEANVIVANHDLVLADLALGGGAILPPPEDCIYIFDEAHHLADKCLNHFAAQVRLVASERWLSDTRKALGTLASPSEMPGGLRSELNGLTSLLDRLEGAQAAVAPVVERITEALEPGATLRFEGGVVPEELRTAAQPLADALTGFCMQAESLLSRMEAELDRGQLPVERELFEDWLGSVGAMQLRAESTARLWRSYAVRGEQETPPRARWIRSVPGQSGQADLELCSSPILAASTLQQQLWERCFAAILTSATLTALGQFDRFDMRNGLGENARFECVPSPFAYAENAELIVPAQAVEAGDAARHTEALINALPELVTDTEGTLVLFSSRRQMETVHEALKDDWHVPILVQGMYSKQETLNRHRDRIDSGAGSVLFGLASFAEGVDLPGRYCEHVLIAKIPFAVPDDPVEASLAEWIERNKGNAFMEVSVPDAALRLVQASGRLLRKETDTGRITIFDRRLVSKRYGKRMLQSLPPFRQRIEAPA